MSQYTNLNEVKIQVDETTQIMKNNIEKVLERDGKLGDLESRSEELSEGARRFDKKTNKLKWKMYWADKRFLAGIIIVLLFLVLILVIILSKK
jgi:hypothetical protein